MSIYGTSVSLPRDWAAWSVRHATQHDIPALPGLQDLDEAITGIPAAQQADALRRGLLWARMGLGDAVVWSPGPLALRQQDLYPWKLQDAWASYITQWSTLMGACFGGLAVARAMQSQLDKAVGRVPDTLPPEDAYQQFDIEAEVTP